METSLLPGAFLRQAPALDPADRAIVEHLQEDGRRSFARIARATGLAEKTVRSRMKHLLDSEIIQIAAVTDPRALGYHSSALLGLVLDPAAPASETARKLLSVSVIDYVVVATGRYGLFAEVICHDRRELQDVIENRIGGIEGIRTIESFPYLSLHYQLANFGAARRKSPREAGVFPHTLTRTDRDIVKALSENGRMPLQAVADRLGISESQVRNRFNAMAADGVVSVIAIVNPMSLGYGTVAWTAVRVGGGISARDVADGLSGLSHVTYVAICAGRFDIFSEVACRDEAELLAIIDHDIRPLKGVMSIEISIYQHLHYKRLTPIAAPT